MAFQLRRTNRNANERKLYIMTNKNTKKTLLTSVLALVLCLSMLVGTTFAWFTDTVSTTNNIITAGNLDVNLYWSTDAQNWNAVTAGTNVFKTNTLWEPGHTEVVYLKVVNEGTLALTYNLNLNVASEVAGTNVAGETFLLSNYIHYDLTEGEYTFADSAAARGDEVGVKLNTPTTLDKKLLSNEEVVLTLVVFMPTTVGNEANYRGTAVPTINLGINLFATQEMHENDTFGSEYDKFAAVKAEELGNAIAEAVAAGKTEYTADANGANINLNAMLTKAMVPAGFELTVENANVVGRSYGNGVDGDVIFENCTFRNADGAYSIHFDKGAGTVTFNNCTLYGWNSFGSTLTSVTLNDCTLLGNGTYAFIRSYVDMTLNNCVIDTTAANHADEWPEGVETVEGGVLTTNNCTFIEPTTTEEVLANGGNATLSADMTTDTIAVNGGILNGNGNTITIENEANDTSNFGVETTGGTISNVTITGDSYEYNGKTYGFRAVYASNASDDIILNNVNIDATYCININDSDYAGGLYVSDSVLNGWISYGSAKEAVFTNCSFGESTTGYANLRPYADTALIGCDFAEGYTITRNSVPGDAFTITLTNCTVNGVAVTVDNFAALLCGDAASAYALQTCAWVTVIVDGAQVNFN